MVGADAANRLEGGARHPRRLFHVVVGPLVAYHAMLLAGALLLVLGIAQAARFWEIAGAALITAGIALELAILGWTAGLVRQAPRATTGAPTRSSGSASTTERWLCPWCGWSGDLPTRICPRCRRLTVRLS